MLLLDTCVLSESTKPKQDHAVLSWLTGETQENLYVSAVSVGELHFGAWRLPEGKKRRQLMEWIATVEADFAGRIVPLDHAISVQWGRIRAELANPPIVDSQIAATALTYGFTLVTRNVKHFRYKGLQVVNPWDR